MVHPRINSTLKFTSQENLLILMFLEVEAVTAFTASTVTPRSVRELCVMACYHCGGNCLFDCSWPCAPFTSLC